MEERKKINIYLYNAAIEEEIKKYENSYYGKSDVKLLESLLNEINQLGFQFHYLADVIFRDTKSKEVLKLIQKYIGKFENKGISAQLVNIIGVKGNTSATESIIKDFNSLDEYKGLAVFYDNALERLKDKRYIKTYLKWLSNPEIAKHLPFTMTLLGKWNIEEAKELFISYLDFERKDELIFISLKSLSFYKKNDVINKIQEMENHPDLNVRKLVMKIIKSLLK